jgi:CPA2 family monovalent cation:H+ antiporter-2
VVLGAVAAFAVPLLAAITRSTRTLAGLLAQRALPTPVKGLDRAAVPRGALIASLHFALMLAASSPVFLSIQFFTPRVPAIAIFALLSLILGATVWNSTRNLYGHATAGADVFGMVLQQHDRVSDPPAELHSTVERVGALLPGLGNPTAALLRADSPAAGQTLRALDLRGRTGAMVLSITHANGHAVDGIPSGSTVIVPGDVLVLAGTAEAVAAARELLSPSLHAEMPSHAATPG